jgi:hypothetical protein
MQSLVDFLLKVHLFRKKFKTNKMSRKGKQRGVDIKQEDVLQAVVRKTLFG